MSASPRKRTCESWPRYVRFVPSANSCTAKKYVHDSITSSARASSGVGTVSPSALAVLRLITRSYLVGACRGRSPGFVPVFSVSHRFRHQPIGAALILFLKKHNNILSVYFSRLSSNCFPPYYIQPGRNILLLKIESSFQNQNKQKRLMSKLSCFARAASHLRPRRAKQHVHARPIHPGICCSSAFTRWPHPHRGL